MAADLILVQPQHHQLDQGKRVELHKVVALVLPNKIKGDEIKILGSPLFRSESGALLFDSSIKSVNKD